MLKRITYRKIRMSVECNKELVWNNQFNKMSCIRHICVHVYIEMAHNLDTRFWSSRKCHHAVAEYIVFFCVFLRDAGLKRGTQRDLKAINHDQTV